MRKKGERHLGLGLDEGLHKRSVEDECGEVEQSGASLGRRYCLARRALHVSTSHLVMFPSTYILSAIGILGTFLAKTSPSGRTSLLLPLPRPWTMASTPTPSSITLLHLYHPSSRLILRHSLQLVSPTCYSLTSTRLRYANCQRTSSIL